jgi:hypothetical protein
MRIITQPPPSHGLSDNPGAQLALLTVAIIVLMAYRMVLFPVSMAAPPQLAASSFPTRRFSPPWIVDEHNKACYQHRLRSQRW